VFFNHLLNFFSDRDLDIKVASFTALSDHLRQKVEILQDTMGLEVKKCLLALNSNCLAC